MWRPCGWTAVRDVICLFWIWTNGSWSWRARWTWFSARSWMTKEFPENVDVTLVEGAVGNSGGPAQDSSRAGELPHPGLAGGLRGDGQRARRCEIPFGPRRFLKGRTSRTSPLTAGPPAARRAHAAPHRTAFARGGSDRRFCAGMSTLRRRHLLCVERTPGGENARLER